MSTETPVLLYEDLKTEIKSADQKRNIDFLTRNIDFPIGNIDFLCGKNC